jgi:hypothetical protein
MAAFLAAVEVDNRRVESVEDMFVDLFHCLTRCDN